MVDKKGIVSRDFLLQVFSWFIFPQDPENNIRVIQNFFENSQRYSQVNVHHRYQRHRWQIFPPFSLALMIPVAILPPVSTIPAANLPPVSTTSVANCRRYQRHRQQICHRCKRHPVANNGNNYLTADRISLLHGYYSIWLQLMFKWFDDKLLFSLSAWLLLHTVWLQRLLF